LTLSSPIIEGDW